MSPNRPSPEPPSPALSNTVPTLGQIRKPKPKPKPKVEPKAKAEAEPKPKAGKPKTISDLRAKGVIAHLDESIDEGLASLDANPDMEFHEPKELNSTTGQSGNEHLDKADRSIGFEIPETPCQDVHSPVVQNQEPRQEAQKVAYPVSYDGESDVVLFPQGVTKGEALYSVSTRIPNNDMGLPLFYYEYSSFPDPGLGHISQQAIDLCARPLDYSQGFPCFSNMHPFWMKMEDEPIISWNLLLQYLEQPKTVGLRQLHLLLESDNNTYGVTEDQLYEWSKGYSWAIRAISYDMFQEGARKRRKTVRLVNAEEQDFVHADKLISKLEHQLDALDWSQLSPIDAVDVLAKLIKIRRVALGVPGDSPLNVNQKPSVNPLTVEGQLREVAMESGIQGRKVGDGKEGEVGLLLQQALSDPTAGMKLQELVIRFAQSQQT